MNPAPYSVSALTDISANIFALLILILVIMLAAQNRQNVVVQARAGQIIDLERTGASVERSPMSSDDLFDLLYERGEQTSSVKVDIFQKDVVVSFDGQTERYTAIDKAMSRLKQIAAASQGGVGLYVFSHAFYRSATGTLQALQRSWREVSIPQALRDFRSESHGQGWSVGFSDLIARPSSREEFRAGLARLLESSSADESANSSRGMAGGASGQRLERMTDSLMRLSRSVLDLIAIFAGLAFVACVEMRQRITLTR